MLCTDCATYVSNDETPAEVDAWREAVNAHDDGTPGYWVVVCEGDDGTDPERAHIDFSNAPCSMCGTTLAGDRCAAEWVETPADCALCAAGDPNQHNHHN